MMPARSLLFLTIALFCLAVGVLLAASHLAFYITLKREIDVQLDRQLMKASAPVVADLAGDPDEADVTEFNLTDEFFEVLDQSGQVVAHSLNLGDRLLPLFPATAPLSQSVFQTLHDEAQGRLRAVFVPFRSRTGALILALARPTRDADRALAMFRRMILVLFPLSLVLMGAVSAWYVGKSLRPVAAEMARLARGEQSP